MEAHCVVEVVVVELAGYVAPVPHAGARSSGLRLVSGPIGAEECARLALGYDPEL